ncbi:MAG: hypothetical protein PHH59_01145 [Methylovulum sp.]|uniref:hypothetical protein n=1 Tax=Methylovulum sp. TaxID=1916980 RepID=UPI0026378051|nr:hypothetical protein [Methylovulum sp.]MDD2722613.1 hypothetical protein [Methylovulum sp.]MDD5123789.1 hypothetical protein [Methylovulum sp.]
MIKYIFIWGWTVVSAFIGVNCLIWLLELFDIGGIVKARGFGAFIIGVFVQIISHPQYREITPILSCFSVLVICLLTDMIKGCQLDKFIDLFYGTFASLALSGLISFIISELTSLFKSEFQKK